MQPSAPSVTVCLVLLWLSIASAFFHDMRPTRTSPDVPVRPITSRFFVSRSTSTRLFYFNFPDKGKDPSGRPIEMELQELENARASFEALVSRQHSRSLQQQQQGNAIDTNKNCLAQSPLLGASSTSLSQDADDVPQQLLLLTNSGRRLRELELELIESLATSDAAIEELIHLWTTERDAETSTYILAMQSVSSECSAGLVQEEAALRLMLEQYPAWAEPYARLATLLFFKGDLQQAVTMAERAVDLKPWHFEALQIAVLLSQQPSTMQHRARRLARRALPKLSDTVARHVWVDRAMAQARQQFREAEKLTQEQNNRQRQRHYIFRENDIWQ